MLKEGNSKVGVPIYLNLRADDVTIPFNKFVKLVNLDLLKDTYHQNGYKISLFYHMFIHMECEDILSKSAIVRSVRIWRRLTGLEEECLGGL
jgi:hypothetical protein